MIFFVIVKKIESFSYSESSKIDKKSAGRKSIQELDECNPFYLKPRLHML